MFSEGPVLRRGDFDGGVLEVAGKFSEVGEDLLVFGYQGVNERHLRIISWEICY